jgi:hypothetical protein
LVDGRGQKQMGLGSIRRRRLQKHGNAMQCSPGVMLIQSSPSNNHNFQRVLNRN